MGKEVLEKILTLLREQGVSFEHITHEHVHHSEDAAKVRGNSIQQAAKAIIFKTELGFIQIVLPGDRLVDYKEVKLQLGVKKIRMATPEESLAQTGCTIGSIPPFAIFWNMKLYVDRGVLDNEFIFFSAGTHNDSVKMKAQDYVAVTHANIIDVSKEKD